MLFYHESEKRRDIVNVAIRLHTFRHFARIFPLIPYRKIEGREPPSMEEVCRTFNLFRKRWMVERAFAWLKRRCRRLMLRWERIALIWNGFAVLGLIYTWMRNLVG